MSGINTVHSPVLGVQSPRLFHAPGPVVGTLGQEAIELAAMAGMDLDEWQQFLMREACSVDPSRMYENTITGRIEAKWMSKEVAVIIARQNGKDEWLVAREIAGLFLFGEKLIIHSAHQFATANEHFLRLVEVIESTPELSRELAVNGIRTGNVEKSITLKSGQRLLFKARSKSGARGFTADLVVMNEAMFLGAEPIGAMMPTMSAKPNGQILYLGSAGDQELGDCSQLGSLRSRGLKGEDPSLVFAEWSADVCGDFCLPDCDEHDQIDAPETAAKANPALGVRIAWDFMQTERRSMTDRDYKREILSVGDYPAEHDAWKVIPREAWERRTDAGSIMGGEFVLGVDITPSRSFACIVACGAQEGDSSLEHLEITSTVEPDSHGEPQLYADHRSMGSWLVPRIIEIWNRAHPAFVVIDKATYAGGIVVQLEAAGVKVVHPNTQQYAQACGEFRAAVVPKGEDVATIVHLGQPQLAHALAEAEKRRLLEMWAWDKLTTSSDISPLVAATLARWGFKEFVHSGPSVPWSAVIDLDDFGFDDDW